ncbi:hypothetical protein [Kitasatospora sp. NPDC057223]|uniref:hypothetical protein n=1 Tax=Kitasatospora sp. NPDC057223 TaxID=3346055 RepID=UPI00362B3002
MSAAIVLLVAPLVVSTVVVMTAPATGHSHRRPGACPGAAHGRQSEAHRPRHARHSS